VRERTVDTFGFWRKRKLNTESNVQFGEGGAGTFSDGKLYSQIKDPKHYGRKVLTEFVKAGAPEEIMYVSKPHIGTFRLVKMVEQMRAKIEALGGETASSNKVVDIEIEQLEGDGGQVRGVTWPRGEKSSPTTWCWRSATARATPSRCCTQRGVYVEAKPFSIGFRVEHPQSLIDACRFGPNAGHRSSARPTTSWCTTPRTAARCTASACARAARWWRRRPSRRPRGHQRHEPVFAQRAQRQQRHRGRHHAGVDYPGHPLAGIEFQRRLEEKAFELGGGTYDAPGQLMGDFVAGRASTEFGTVVPSYKPACT
jgi:uncharacterized FAD-dependent dehydrogenase